LVASNTSAGAVSPETQSSVAAGTNGTVKTIVRKAGEWVRTGEVVVQLDDSQLRLSLQLAQTALQNAVVNAGFDETGKPSPGSTIALKIQYAQSDVLAKQKNYEADQQLLKIGGVTQATLDNDVSAIQNSQATLESLKASVQQSTMAVQTATLQLQQAQLNLANAAIKAPFDGQIAAVNVHPGEYVGTSTAVFVLASRQKILTFTVPPSDAPGLSNRTPVKFTYNGQDYGATITQIPAAPVGGLIPLTASLPVDLSPPLGTVGTIVYTVELARGALVPLQAVQSAENTTFVFTVSKANKVAKSQVTILAETGAFAAVTGVPVGATVILNPPPGILVGSTVQPQAVADAQAAPPAGAAKAPAGAPGQRQGQGKRDASAVPGAPGAAPEAAGAPGGVPGQRQGQGQGAYTGQRRQGTSAPPPAGAPAAAPAPSGGQ
jgi:multidrug efflux pump subunit AcrA (membrane-fusion protein)